MMKLSLNSFKLLIIFLSLVGFPIVGVVAQILNIESYTLSVMLRACVGGVSLILLFFYIKYLKVISKNILFIFIFIFIFIYSIRIIVDTIFLTPPLLHEPSYYWVWFYGACFLPFLIIVFSNNLKFLDSKVELYLYVAFYLVAFFSIMYGSSYVESSFNDDVYNSGRFRLSSINPISLGHIGVILFSLSYFYLDFTKKKFYNLIYISGILLGFYLIVLANSRGPLLALLFIFIFLTIRKYKYYYIVLPVFLFLAFSLFLYFVSFISNEYDIQTLNRIYGDDAVKNSLQDDRLTLYKNAFDGFFSHPIFGSGLEEYKFGFYPHNIYLESFMSTGFFGGIFFTITGFLVFLKSLTFDYRYLWISIFFIDNFISGFFSGAIYSSGYYWVSLGLCLVVIMYTKRKFLINKRNFL